MAIDFSGINANGKPQNSTERRVETLDRSRSGSRSQAVDQSSPPNASDKISLTATATRLKALEAQLAKLPVVDNNRVGDVQRALANGTYSVNAERVAGKLIAFERQLAGKG